MQNCKKEILNSNADKNIAKISLGTVQFGQDYGIANSGGKIDKEEALSILQHAAGWDVESIDTAQAYGESEAVLGELLQKENFNFKITTKLPSLANFEEGMVEKCIIGSLDRLNIPKVYGYLIHKFENFLQYENLWTELQLLKSKKLVERIGFSLYNPSELVFIFEKGIELDIIQVPYSILDRRFEKYFDELKNKNIEIQVRSVFLQGLPFLKRDQLPGDLLKARKQLDGLHKISNQYQIPMCALCLNFVLLNKAVHRVLIGVDSLMHLRENIQSLGRMDQVEEIYDQLEGLSIDDENILLPYNWNIA